MKTLLYFSICVLLLGLLCSGCGKTPITTASSSEYAPPPCARYHHGSVRYINETKHHMVVSAQDIHHDLPLPPYTSKEIHRVPSGEYEIRYVFVGKKKKGHIEDIYVYDCKTSEKSLD